MKPSNAELRDIFDGAAARYDDVTSAYAVARRIEFAQEHAQGRTLEVGAGTGQIAGALMREHEVVATDISLNMVAAMRAKGIEATACDAESLPFPDASFDTVVSAECIYYLDHPQRFLAEANRVLKPGGVLILTSASAITSWYDRARSALRAFGVKSMYFDDPVHTFPSLTKLRTLAIESGFEITHTDRFVILPNARLDKFNRFLEKTPLAALAAFTGLVARKT